MQDEKEGDKSAKGNWYILIYNLRSSESPIFFSPGLSLKSLESAISVFDLAALGGAGFRQWAVLEPFLPCCYSEIASSADAATTNGYDSLN